VIKKGKLEGVMCLDHMFQWCSECARICFAKALPIVLLHVQGLLSIVPGQVSCITAWDVLCLGNGVLTRVEQKGSCSFVRTGEWYPYFVKLEIGIVLTKAGDWQVAPLWASFIWNLVHILPETGGIRAHIQLADCGVHSYWNKKIL